MLSILKNHPPVVVAYVAGVIESKASVGLTVEAPKGLVYPSIELYHRSTDFLYLLQNYIGGTVTKRKNRQCKLFVRYQNAADVLEDIEPYCLVLKPLIKKVLEYQNWTLNKTPVTKAGAYSRKQTMDKFIYEVLEAKIQIGSANHLDLNASRFLHPTTKDVFRDKLRRLYGGEESPPEETDTAQD